MIEVFKMMNGRDDQEVEMQLPLNTTIKSKFMA